MRGAVVYATFVVALVFLPVLTMSGVQGRLFAPLAMAYISGDPGVAAGGSHADAGALRGAAAAGASAARDETRLIAALKERYRALHARA